MGAARAGLSSIIDIASVGGLVGENDAGATITQSYSTGAVSSSDPAGSVGGFIGNNDSTTPSDVDGNYFDTLTSGTTLGIGAGNGASGVTGQTTAQLQGALPSGFDNTVWGTASASIRISSGSTRRRLWRSRALPIAMRAQRRWLGLRDLLRRFRVGPMGEPRLRHHRRQRLLLYSWHGARHALGHEQLLT